MHTPGTGACRAGQKGEYFAMLKTVRQSANSKTGPIAVTYRAGASNVFSTCPRTCPLNPQPAAAAGAIDRGYLAALRRAVPRNGRAWTYSHFPAAKLPKPAPGETVINFSADTLAAALKARKLGRPTTLTIGAGVEIPKRVDDVRFVRCPAEVSDAVTCSNCGDGEPLCARGERDFVVTFTAHGSQARRVGTDEPGGCYGAGGHVALQWRATSSKGAPDDAAALERFARELPPGSFLRHHVVGDIGRPA
jgi:hypothetical protein